MKYGLAPTVICEVNLRCPEFMFIQYMPIKLAGAMYFLLPENLHFLYPLLEKIVGTVNLDDYVYVTVKHLYVKAGTTNNREGWHSDGFGTNDTNYIWCDALPTVFCVQDFILSDDHELSLVEMEQQVRAENCITYPTNTLLKLSPAVIHRAVEATENTLRTFIKVSVSKDRYNLRGNAHNYLLNYQWEMAERKPTRNHPSSR